MDFNFRNPRAITTDHFAVGGEEEALKEQRHRRALAFLEAIRRQQNGPLAGGGPVSALGRSLGEQQIDGPGAAAADVLGLDPGKISNAGFTSLQRNFKAVTADRNNLLGRSPTVNIAAPASTVSAASATSSAGAESDDDSRTFASPGAANRDYQGSGHASMNQRNAVDVPKGYVELEITVSPLGNNLGFGQIIPGIGKKVAKASQPGVFIKVLDEFGNEAARQTIQLDPGEVETNKYEISSRVAHTVFIDPVGSAVWDYTVYANNFFSDMPSQ